jgi:hypothetical protein
MALSRPIWLQNQTYSARLDRTFADVLFTEGVIDPGSGSLLVSERAAGPNNTVDIAVGIAVIEGDDETNQGKYVVRNEAVVNLAFAPAPTSDSRIDLVVVEINDSTAGSLRTPADLANFKVIAGVVAGSPVAPAVADTAVVLAQVLRTSGDSFIDNSMITDLRVVVNGNLPSAGNVFEKTASYTLVLSDAFGIVEMNVATANTLTVPPNADAPFPIGTQIVVLQTGAGQTTLTAGSGVTVNSKGGSLKLSAQWAGATIIKRSTNLWVAVGDLAP